MRRHNDNIKNHRNPSKKFLQSRRIRGLKEIQKQVHGLWCSLCCVTPTFLKAHSLQPLRIAPKAKWVVRQYGNLINKCKVFLFPAGSKSKYEGAKVTYTYSKSEYGVSDGSFERYSSDLAKANWSPDIVCIRSFSISAYKTYTKKQNVIIFCISVHLELENIVFFFVIGKLAEVWAHNWLIKV